MRRWSSGTGGCGWSSESVRFGPTPARLGETQVHAHRLLQRAVVVIGPDGRVVHAEYVGDQVAEPDSGAALDAARLSAGRVR